MAYKVLHDRLCICLVPCKLSYLYMLRYPRNMTNISKKCLTTAKHKKEVFTDWYTAGICKKIWYVVGI